MAWLWLLLTACSGGSSSDATPETAPAPAPQLQIGTVDPGSGAGSGSAPADAVLTHDDCDDVSSDPLPADGCLTGRLTCGSEITGHTEGGVNRFDTRFYEQFFCTPATTDHDDGNERVYALEMPEGDWHADIWLDTPCADLDLAAFRWEGEGCPDKGARIDVCEMNRQSRNKREHIRLASRGPTTWLVVVEGEGVDEGAFGLKVTCEEGL